MHSEWPTCKESIIVSHENGITPDLQGVEAI